MPFYPDSQTLRSVMQDLFDRLNNTPNATDTFLKNKMLVHIYLDNPKVFLGLDGRQRPVGITFSRDGAKPDLAIRMDADMIHAIWLGQVRLRDAYFKGDVKTKGSIFKAMKLADLFRQAENLYPTVLKDREML